MFDILYHFRVRRCSIKPKQLILLLLLVVSLLGFKHNSESGTKVTLPSPDQILSLQAEVGYLRKKLAQCGSNVDLEIDHFVPIFVITPTFARDVQKAELTRLANVFLLIPNLHWIVVEDSHVKTNLVSQFLLQSGLKYTHLNKETPGEMKLKPKDPHWSKPRGVYQRNEAIAWLRNNYAVGESGVVYFADDDNTYSTELFQVISATSKVAVFPVGLVGGVMVEKPNVVAGKVVSWSVGWGKDRPFATDMAGFAIGLSYLLSHTSAKFATEVKIGYLESEFLKHLVHLEDLEPISVDKVLVWHTRTEKPNLNQEKRFIKSVGHSSAHGMEV